MLNPINYVMFAEPLFSSMPLPLFQSPNRRSFPKAATRCTPGPGYRPKPQQQTWLTCHRSRVLVGARAPTISHYEEFQVVNLISLSICAEKTGGFSFKILRVSLKFQKIHLSSSAHLVKPVKVFSLFNAFLNTLAMPG